MRFLLYNIRYGTGGRRRRFPLSGYLGLTSSNLDKITAFIGEVNPDVAGLVEVDAGSYRSASKNQAEWIAGKLGHYHTYGSKYTSRFANIMPLMNKQGNAFLAKDTITKQHFHYFDKGVKRLVIELELENLTLFLVHLSLSFRVRHHQLSDLYKLVRETKRPHIVAGDFNSLWGEKEIHLFLAATGLQSADPEIRPSFPCWDPQRHLDFILHSREIDPQQFSMPQVDYSDHLPLLFDFSIKGA